MAVLLTATIWARVFHASEARAEVTTIRLGHIGFPGSLFDVVAQEYARRVNAELKRRYEVKVFHSSQLGSDEQMVKGIWRRSRTIWATMRARRASFWIVS